MGQFALNSVENSPAPALQQNWVSLLVDVKMILLGSAANSYKNISIDISVIISIGTGDSNFQVEVTQFSAPIQYSSRIWVTATQSRQVILQFCYVLLVVSVWHLRTCLPEWVQFAHFSAHAPCLAGCKPCLLQKPCNHISRLRACAPSQPDAGQPQPRSHVTSWIMGRPDTQLATQFLHEP